MSLSPSADQRVREALAKSISGPPLDLRLCDINGVHIIHWNTGHHTGRVHLTEDCPGADCPLYGLRPAGDNTVVIMAGGGSMRGTGATPSIIAPEVTL